MYYGFVYEWTNKLNNKKYIGSHAGAVDDGYIGSGKVFLRAIKKYGIENFSRSIIEYITVEDRRYLLEREKFYLDKSNAYYSDDYYNIAKDVIGGDTKAGWTDERRQKFKQQIKDVWANRTEEEKREILDRSHSKTREWLQSKDGEAFKQKQRDSFLSKKDKIIEAIKNRDPEDRKRSARLGKERMGEERRKEAARKAAESWTEETKKIAKEKTKQTRAAWSEEKLSDVFNNMSTGRKGKCSGSKNGRARKIIADSKKFDTLKAAILELKISEATLYKRLRDPNNKEYYYL